MCEANEAWNTNRTQMENKNTLSMTTTRGDEEMVPGSDMCVRGCGIR